MKISKATLKKRRLAWITALESKTMNQTTGSLCLIEYVRGHRDKTTMKLQESFCCLGVACAVYNAEVSPNHTLWAPARSSAPNGRYSFEDEVLEPSHAVREYYQMSDADVSHLVHMNDEDHASFLEIADYLREYWGFKPSNIQHPVHTEITDDTIGSW